MIQARAEIWRDPDGWKIRIRADDWVVADLLREATHEATYETVPVFYVTARSTTPSAYPPAEHFMVLASTP
jgi:hypothetical protein